MLKGARQVSLSGEWLVGLRMGCVIAVVLVSVVAVLVSEVSWSSTLVQAAVRLGIESGPLAPWHHTPGMAVVGLLAVGQVAA